MGGNYILFFVTCLVLSLQTSGQLGRNRIGKYNEIKQFSQDTMTTKKLVKKLLEKVDDLLNQVNNITEKVATLDAIYEKLDDLASDIAVPYSYKTGYRVHHFQSPQGSYKYSYAEGVARCQDEGMTIATPQQLQVAWEKGMDVCACGWLSDGSNRYPIQYPRRGCGSGTSGGVITCSNTIADVYCFK